MNLLTVALTIFGLAFFEAISSVDNAVINAQVLASMSDKSRKWFLGWGLLLAVFLMRGIIPLLVVWLTNPSIGILGSLAATFSSDIKVTQSIEQSAPILLFGGGTFLLFLFLHWLFLESKAYGLKGERFIHEHGLWFYASGASLVIFLAWLGSFKSMDLIFSAAVGTVAFFIIQGFKFMAEREEKRLVSDRGSDVSKIVYLEIIDATFSIDGVLGAFAFTLSIPLILVGSAIGALVVRQLTVGNIERIRRYVYLENGAMYSIFFLGLIMVFNSLGMNIPEWVSPIVTFLVVGYFFLKSRKAF